MSNLTCYQCGEPSVYTSDGLTWCSACATNTRDADAGPLVPLRALVERGVRGALPGGVDILELRYTADDPEGYVRIYARLTDGVQTHVCAFTWGDDDAGPSCTFDDARSGHGNTWPEGAETFPV